MEQPSAPATLAELSPASLATEPAPFPLDRSAPAGAGDAPSARRNAGPLLAVLRRVLPTDGTVLEIGAGTAQHAVAFAAALAPLRWLPTDPRPTLADSLARWSALLPEEAARPLPARVLDAAAPSAEWPVGPADGVCAVLSTNVIHIAPWAVAEGLLAGAAALLAPGDPLMLYGPFRRGGDHTGDGNARFDASLRAEDPSWGIRDLEGEVVPAAEAAGFVMVTVQPMPADNLVVVFRRRQRETLR